MRDLSCKLLTKTIAEDSIGTQIETVIETEIPIIRIEDIRANEFYSANEQGFRPTLRIITSSLNYNGQEELIYMSQNYSIIRTQEIVADEIVLICERKVKNG